MKKILAFLLILSSFTLASCKGKDTTKRIDQPSEELIAEFQLDKVAEGVSIVEVDKSKKEYYDIKIASDAKSTLFVYNSMLDSTFEEHKELLRDVVVNPLVFKGAIYTDEKELTTICSTVFDSKKGLTGERLGVSFDLITTTTWTSKVDAREAVDAYLNDGVKNNCVSIIYLPIKVEHVDNSKSVLESHILMPIYYELTTYTDGVIASDKFAGFEIKEIEFNDSYEVISVK